MSGMLYFIIYKIKIVVYKFVMKKLSIVFDNWNAWFFTLVFLIVNVVIIVFRLVDSSAAKFMVSHSMYEVVANRDLVVLVNGCNLLVGLKV